MDYPLSSKEILHEGKDYPLSSKETFHSKDYRRMREERATAAKIEKLLEKSNAIALKEAEFYKEKRIALVRGRNIISMLLKLAALLQRWYFLDVMSAESNEILAAVNLVNKLIGFYQIEPFNSTFNNELYSIVEAFKPLNLETEHLDIKKLNSKRLEEILNELTSSSAAYKDFSLNLGLSMFKNSNSINRC